MPKLSSLKNSHKGDVALVLCGGPTLLDEMSDTSGVTIAVNYHAGRVGIITDYSVQNDVWPPEFVEELEEYTALETLSTVPGQGSIELDHTPLDMGNTVSTAVWFAKFLGCDPVVICGVDCYTGDPWHCWKAPGTPPDLSAATMAAHYPVEACLAFWSRLSDTVGGLHAPRGSLLDTEGVLPVLTASE